MKLFSTSTWPRRAPCVLPLERQRRLQVRRFQHAEFAEQVAQAQADPVLAQDLPHLVRRDVLEVDEDLDQGLAGAELAMDPPRIVQPALVELAGGDQELGEHRSRTPCGERRGRTGGGNGHRRILA